MSYQQGDLRREIVFASTNRGKAAEVKRAAAHLGYSIVGLSELQAAQSLPPVPHIAETESFYEGNAVRKAVGYADWLGRPCIVDDTGLEIEELGGLPGVYTANFGIARVQELLAPNVSFRARFVCCVIYAEPTGRRVPVTATLDGLVRFPSSVHDDRSGVPFSRYFIPSGESESLAALQEREGFLSHRGRAIALLLRALGDSTMKRT
jgi:XTP/dITP diphosphohydrolase